MNQTQEKLINSAAELLSSGYSGRRRRTRKFVDWAIEQLHEHEVFSSIRGKNLVQARDEALDALYYMCLWCARQVAEGIEPDQAIRDILIFMERGSFPYFQGFVYEGVEVSEAHEIVDNAVLKPWPDPWFERRARLEPVNPGNRGPSLIEMDRWDMPRSVLYVRYACSPLLTESTDWSPSDPTWLERRRLATDLQRALNLAGAVGACVAYSFNVPAEDDYPRIWHGYRVEAGRWTGIRPSPADLPRTKHYLTQLQDFGERGEIDMATDRLISARGRNYDQLADRFLDLGIAAEVLLLAEKRAPKSEIRYKLALRAAWLLGKDASQRSEILRLAKELYDARSKAAHGGRATDNHIPKLPEYDHLIASLVREVLARGSLPDWDDLVCGGLPPPMTAWTIPFNRTAPGAR